VLRIRDVRSNPGFEFFHLGSKVKKAPDPRSGFATKIKVFLTKKLLRSSRKYDSGCVSQILDPDFFLILDPQHCVSRYWIRLVGPHPEHYRYQFKKGNHIMKSL
jgi:hypothetical protein